MTPYYLTLFAITLTSVMAGRMNINEKQLSSGKYKYTSVTNLLLFFTIAILTCVGGLRYYVGADYGGYYHALETYPPRLEESIKNLDEPGLPIITSILLWFTDDGAYAIFTFMAITMILLLTTNYRYCSDFLFMTLLVVLTGSWTGSFNGVRQYMASAVIFAGHRLIYEKKFWKYALVVFIAFCFHSSAIIMLLPYFILRNRITFKNVVLLAVGTLIVASNYDRIFEFVGFLKDSEMTMGDNAYYSGTVNTLRVLVFCAPAIVVLFLYYGRQMNLEQTFYINTLIINGAAMLAASNSTYLARVSIYTNLFAPIAMAKLFRLENKTFQLLTRFIIIVLFGIFFFYEITNSTSLSPFKWIWER